MEQNSVLTDLYQTLNHVSMNEAFLYSTENFQQYIHIYYKKQHRGSYGNIELSTFETNDVPYVG